MPFVVRVKYGKLKALIRAAVQVMTSFSVLYVVSSITIDSIVKGLETGLINTFTADSPRCAVDNIVDSFYGALSVSKLDL